MTPEIEAILIDAVDALEAGESAETILRRYPEHADELRPMLETVISLQTLSHAPTTAIKRRERLAFLSRVDEARQSFNWQRWFTPLSTVLPYAALAVLIFVVWSVVSDTLNPTFTQDPAAPVVIEPTPFDPPPTAEIQTTTPTAVPTATDTQAAPTLTPLPIVETVTIVETATAVQPETATATATASSIVEPIPSSTPTVAETEAVEVEPESDTSGQIVTATPAAIATNQPPTNTPAPSEPSTPWPTNTPLPTGVWPTATPIPQATSSGQATPSPVYDDDDDGDSDSSDEEDEDDSSDSGDEPDDDD